MKGRKQKSLLSAMLALLVCAAFSLCACSDGGGKASNTPEVDIEIAYWVSGFGVDYMNEIVAKFREKYPQYNVTFNSNSSMTQLSQSLSKGKDNTVDLYFCSWQTLSPYSDSFAPLDDVYDSAAEGETRTIGSKFPEDVKSTFQLADGHYYGLSYAGTTVAIAYNGDVIDGVNRKVPNTSDELAALSIEIANDRNAPAAWVHFEDLREGYYYGMLRTWQAQYSGIDYYMNNWLTLTEETEEGKVSPSINVYLSETDGRKAALEALGKCVATSTVLRNSNTMTYTNAQTHFVEGEAAMMANGGWLQNQMANTGGREMNMRMMKVPVLSALREKLPSVNTDSQLSALVSAIDAYAGGEKPLAGSGYSVTEEEWDRVSAARNYGYNNGAEHVAAMSKYTNSPTASKAFLQFYFSEVGLSEYVNTLHQLPSATLDESTEIDRSSWSAFENDLYEISQNQTVIHDGGLNKEKLFSMNGQLNPYANVGLLNSLSASRPSDVKSASAIWESVKSEINSKWTSWLWNAGYTSN